MPARTRFLVVACSAVVAAASFAEDARGPAGDPSPPADGAEATLAGLEFARYARLTTEAGELRESRRVPLEKFLELAAEEGTVLLDARSREAFDRRHLRGAVHLNFSDFTEESLAKVIPAKTTQILIYCNNNFRDAPASFPSKRVALNIPTFVNLYGYGYGNVYELRDLLSVDDARLAFDGSETAVAPVKAP